MALGGLLTAICRVLGPSAAAPAGAPAAGSRASASGGGASLFQPLTSSRAANVLVAISTMLGCDGFHSYPGAPDLLRAFASALRAARTCAPRSRATSATSTPARNFRSARPSSSASLGRSLGSSAIARPMTSSSGKRRGSTSLGRGCGARMAASHSASVARRNGAVPLHVSISNTATAKMSVAGPSSLPSTCSGGMCPGEPNTSCPATRAGAAMPKSMTLTCPSSSIIALRGVTSRWTTCMRRWA